MLVGGKCGQQGEALHNPAIQFSSPPFGISQTFGPNDVLLAPVHNEDASSVITAFRVQCKLPNTLPPKTGDYYTKDDHMSVAFMSYRGQYYRHDPRARLLRNTLNAPANDSTASASNKCPSVARNLFNDPTCKRQHACSPVAFGSSIFQLNATVLRQFFTTETKCAAHALLQTAARPCLGSAVSCVPIASSQFASHSGTRALSALCAHTL